MENDIQKEPDESFESLTLPLANCVEHATKLPESADELFFRQPMGICKK